MKKIVFALGAILAAGVMQAATVSWGMTQVYGYGTDGSATSQRATGYIAYLMVGDGSGMTALAGSEVADIKSYVAANNTYGGSATTSAGSVTVDAYGDYAATAEMSVYAVVFDAATIDDASHFYVTAAAGLQIPDSGNGAVAFGKQKTGTTNTSNWYAVGSSSGGDTPSGVPEPTSGLLMLVGLGALALRRRR